MSSVAPTRSSDLLRDPKRPTLSTTYGSKGTKQDSNGSRMTIIGMKETTVRSYSEDTIRTVSRPQPHKVREVLIATSMDTSKGSVASALPSARKGVIQSILKDSSASLSKTASDTARAPRVVPVRSISDDKQVSFATSTHIDDNASDEEVIVTDLRDVGLKASSERQEYRPREDARRSSIQSSSTLVDPGRMKERFERLDNRQDHDQDDRYREREHGRERVREHERERDRSGARGPARTRSGRAPSRSSVGSRGSGRHSLTGSEDGRRARAERGRERSRSRDNQLTLRSAADGPDDPRSANDNFDKPNQLVRRGHRRGSVGVDSKYRSEREIQDCKDAQNLAIAYRGTGCNPSLGTCSIFLNTELVYFGDNVDRDRYLDRVILRSRSHFPRSEGGTDGVLSRELDIAIRGIQHDLQKSLEDPRPSSSLPSASRLRSLMGRWDRSWGTDIPQELYPFLFGLQCQMMKRTLEEYRALDRGSDQKPKPVLISAREWKSGEFEGGIESGGGSGSGRTSSRSRDSERQAFRFCHAAHSDGLGHSVFISAHGDAAQCFEPDDEPIRLPGLDFDVLKYKYRTINSRYAGRTRSSHAGEEQRACGSSRYPAIRGDTRR